MIDSVKCECGHANPTETVLCESCGKPLIELPEHELLEMRYDGIARRSQRTNPSVTDRIWRFFSSVKVAVNLIIFTLLLSSVGTIFPQESTLITIDGFKEISPEEYYSSTYGAAGELYYAFGFSHTYSSWWLTLLLILIGTSLVICSLDRILPLYRALSKQQAKKHPFFLRRQRLSLNRSSFEESWNVQFLLAAKKHGYKTHEVEDAIFLEKNRFSRWGPYINHIGLIVFLIALVFRSMVPDWTMDQYNAFTEGEIRQVPNTPFYLENKKFTLEYYPNESIPKLFQTDAVLYKCTSNCDNPNVDPTLKELMTKPIRVNEPLEYDGYSFYQYQFSIIPPQLNSIHVTLRSLNLKNQQTYGQFTLSLKNPKPEYTVGEYHLTLIDYKPDFSISADKKPTSKTQNANAPGFVFQVNGPNIPAEGKKFMYFPLPKDKAFYREADLNAKVGSPVELGVNGMQDLNFATAISYLNVRTDRVLPWIFAGIILFLVGVSIGLYWQHRRVWVRFDGSNMILGAHTNKNWLGFRRELYTILIKSGLTLDERDLVNSIEQEKEISNDES